MHFRTSIQIRGEKVTTLKYILPRGREQLNVLFVGKVPAPLSVETGHYLQGRQGKAFWNKLQEHGILKLDGEPFEDLALLRHGYGIMDIVRVPRTHGNEPSSDEYRKGMSILRKKIEHHRPKVIVFLYIGALRKVLDTDNNGNLAIDYGFNPHLDTVFPSKLFVFPMPRKGGPNRRLSSRHLRQLQQAVSGLRD